MSAVFEPNPSSAPAPVGRYSNLVRVPRDTDLVFVSGQVGNRLDGSLAVGIADQTRQVFENIGLLLESLGCTPRDLVRLLTFVSGAENVAEWGTARGAVYDEWFADGAYPGHSLAVVEALVSPEILIEVEGWIAVPRDDR